MASGFPLETRKLDRKLGKRLMGIAVELEKLDELHARGTLTDDEFGRAKGKLLSPGSAVNSEEVAVVLNDQLIELRRQNQIAQLDRDWDQLDRSYLFIGPYGRLYRPTLLMGFFVAFTGGLFGSLWVAMAFFMSTAMSTLSPYAAHFAMVNDSIFWIGVVIVLASIIRGIYLCLQSIMFYQAYAAYRRRQAELARSTI